MATGNRIGIRLEDKNEWERRAPLTPADVAALVELATRRVGVERLRARRLRRRGSPCEQAARLVNIGKIRIPRSLLVKGGSLTDQELKRVREAMKAARQERRNQN